MCGGFGVKLSRIPRQELNKFYDSSQINQFTKKGELTDFFWSQRPVLPVEIDDQTKLFDWGNRDEKEPFPKTGWAKKESIDDGKWNWQHPQKVHIPIDRGYEKGVWFDFPAGTDGLLVEKNGEQRIYMITEPADKKYLEQTGHDRMPPGLKKYSYS